MSTVPPVLTETLPAGTPNFGTTATQAQIPIPGTVSIEIIDDKGMSMVLVASGEFTMGSENGNNDEKPSHMVYLNEFYIDKFEVTNAAYRACVEDGVCEALTRSMRFNLSEFSEHPVVFVKWTQAKSYCEWRGARLPTEAEWEKAARGNARLTFPWGDGFDCDRVNFANCVGDTVIIGSYEGGKSP